MNQVTSTVLENKIDDLYTILIFLIIYIIFLANNYD